MKLKQALVVQARACRALDSPFMGQLLDLLARCWPTDSSLGQLCARWSGEIGPAGASLPLRIAGGLHALVLAGRDDGLAAVYPPASSTDAELERAVLAALERHEAFLLKWMQNAPQTNEVRRSAVLIPAAHLIAARHPLPFVISELGASGGLNLMWDRFALDTGERYLGPDNPALTLTPDWSGPMPEEAEITVADRRGVDLNPLDLSDPEQALRLFAYLWPDQPHRMELTRAAMAAHTATVDRGDAIDWLERRLAKVPRNHMHLIFHTIAWQYFPPDRQARGTRLIEAAGARATDNSPLGWLAMENDGASDGAALTLRLWPGDLRLPLGRADFHGRWIKWEQN